MWSSLKNGKLFTTIPNRNRITARFSVCQAISARAAPFASRAWQENTIDAPTTNRKVGNTRSVAVSPIQSAWCISAHAPRPPLLFTMIMNAMVMPRSTSTEIYRCPGAVFCTESVIPLNTPRSVFLRCRLLYTPGLPLANLLFFAPSFPPFRPLVFPVTPSFPGSILPLRSPINSERG